MMIENITTRHQLMAFQRQYGMRDSWHEPDEQDVDAYPAVGTNFDNASCRPDDFEVHYARRQDEGGVYDTVCKIDLATRVHPIKNVGAFVFHGAEHGVFLFHGGEPVAFVNLALLLAMACGYEGY